MTSPMRFGGRGSLPRSTSDNGAIEPLLSRLSWKYVTDEPIYERYPINLLDEYSFRATLIHWIGRVWIPANEMPAGDALRAFDVMSLADQFRDFVATHGEGFLEEGLTLDECWGSAQLLFAEPVRMLICKDFEAELGEHVPRVGLHAQQLVWALAAICLEFGYTEPSFSALVTDGIQGHTILIAGLSGISYQHPRGQVVNDDWLSFHDPLPARSFLALERTFPGAGALEDVSRPPYWIISPDDLSKAVVAFALPHSMLQAMRNAFIALNHISASWVRSGMEGPLWNDLGDRPFGLMLALKGGKTQLTEGGLRGLAKLAVLKGELGMRI